MPETTFFVKDDNGTLVPAKYLTWNGQIIDDPNKGNAKLTAHLLFDARGQQLAQQNTGDHLVVPADYSISKAIAFARSIDFINRESVTVPFVDTKMPYGHAVALNAMMKAFLPGGSQDLQRSYGGRSNQSVVRAFRSAASFNLGFITTYAGLPISDAEIGGGALNEVTKWRNELKNDVRRLLRRPPNEPNIDTSGALGNTPDNIRSIDAGSNLAKSISQLRSPLGDWELDKHTWRTA